MKMEIGGGEDEGCCWIEEDVAEGKRSREKEGGRRRKSKKVKLGGGRGSKKDLNGIR